MNLDDLRKPKFNIGGMDIAIFDVSATIAGGYVLADYMKWNKPKTIVGAFVTGYVVHNMMGVSTPLNDRINQTFAERPVDGIENSDLPINNSTLPVGVNETRYSTM